MKPVTFKQANKTLGRPLNMTDDEYGELPVYAEDNQLVSCWIETSLWKRIKFLFTGKIWLGVMTLSGTQPPVWIDIEYPFNEPI